MENEEKINYTKYKSLIVSGIIFIMVITIVSMMTFKRNESVKLNEESINVYVDESYRIDYELSGLNAEQLIWNSTNEDVAIVDAKGNVIGINTGKAIIYVSDDENIKAMIEINVLDKSEK